MALTEETRMEHYAAGSAAAKDGRLRDPDSDPFVQTALQGIPPGAREVGSTADAIRHAWLAGYDRAREMQQVRARREDPTMTETPPVLPVPDAAVRQFPRELTAYLEGEGYDARKGVRRIATPVVVAELRRLLHDESRPGTALEALRDRIIELEAEGTDR